MLGGFVGMAAGTREFTLAVGPLGSVDVEPRLDRATLTGVRPGCVGTVGGCLVALPPPSPPGGQYCDITRCPRVGVAERCPNSHVTCYQGYRAHVGGLRLHPTPPRVFLVRLLPGAPGLGWRSAARFCIILLLWAPGRCWRLAVAPYTS